MDKLIINGSRPLRGEVKISGMKNAALPILFATIIANDVCTIENVPPIGDIHATLRILRTMGAQIEYEDETTVRIDTRGVRQGTSPDEIVSTLRGSTYLLGAELGRFSRTHVGVSGGCLLGARPIDMHLYGFRKLGAQVSDDGSFVSAYAADGLRGTKIVFDKVSVGATCNMLLAACTAEGETVIDNAAREPHIVDLANFLNSCGANITGAGTTVIKVHGVNELHGCHYTIIPDMIEAGTYMVAAAATGGCVRINSIIPKHVETITAKLSEMGVEVEELDDAITVKSNRTFSNVNIKTLPYPGFPTDMHPQFAPLLCLAKGISSIQESIWENRYRYVDELRKMGATIILDSRNATFISVERLTGAPVEAMDLRAGAALIIAGLMADGVTEIGGVRYIKRGYDDIVGKLRSLGADIEEITAFDTP
jgi:UDP-N-acetylglucosamine 1-carboxyvinyltransferase